MVEVDRTEKKEPYGVCLDCGRIYPLPGWDVSGVYGLCPECRLKRVCDDCEPEGEVPQCFGMYGWSREVCGRCVWRYICLLFKKSDVKVTTSRG